MQGGKNVASEKSTKRLLLHVENCKIVVRKVTGIPNGLKLLVVDHMEREVR